MPTTTARNASPPSLCRHKPSGRAYVRLGGRTFYLGPWGTTESRAEYDRIVAEWLTHGRRLPGADAPADLTATELIARYWEHVQRYYVKNGQPTSEQDAIKASLRPVRRLYGDTSAATFGPTALKACRQALIDAGHVRTAVNRHVHRMKAMFKWAVEQELVPASVLHGLQAVSGLKRGRSEAPEAPPVRPVPVEHVEVIREHVPAPVWAMVELQRLTGMRSGEVTIMRGCDLDTTGKLWLYRPASHKTEHHGHERIVELGPKTQKIIAPFLKADLAAYLFSPADAMAGMRARRTRERKTPLRYGNRPGTNRKRRPKRIPDDHYTRDSYRRCISRACKKAGVPSWFPHQLRHLYASGIRKQYGLEAARILCGHKSMAVTEVYAEVDREKVRAIVARIG